MKSQELAGYLIGVTLPIIGFNVGALEVLIESYKLTLPVLLYFCITNSKSIKINEFVYYLIFLFYIIIIFTLSSANEFNLNIISEKQKELINEHIFIQFGSIFLFSTLLLFITHSKLKEIFLLSIIKGYIYALIFHCIIAALILILELVGIIPVELISGLGLYKMKGILGEPKQFSAAMFSGYLLLKLSIGNVNVFLFKKDASKQIQKLFLVCGFLSFSTSFIINFIILSLYFLVLKIDSKINYFAKVLIIIPLSALTLITSSPCEIERSEYDLGEGFSSIIAKVSTLQNAISFLPKDGLVLMDAACKPQEYIFGGGPGSLYRKLVSDELSNYSWYSEIQIFSEIINGESETRQGPSTLQIMLLSDYGLVGLLLFIFYVIKLESTLRRKIVSQRSFIIIYFFIFINSMLYLWILFIMHLIILKIKPISVR